MSTPPRQEKPRNYKLSTVFQEAEAVARTVKAQVRTSPVVKAQKEKAKIVLALKRLHPMD